MSDEKEARSVLRDALFTIVDDLDENAQLESDQWKNSLMRMYLFSMGEYSFTPEGQEEEFTEEPSGESTLLADEGETPLQKRTNLTLRKRMANEELNQIGGLSLVGQLLKMKID